jgi:predicted metal-dependent enzyme (double-stranded beta helix superfamily)
MRPSFSHVPRFYGRDLSGAELERFVGELAARPELWIDLVKHDRTQRVYEELFSDNHVTAWLICWMEDHDTGFHDHDISSGAVAVVSGHVREERLTLDGPPAKSVFGAGESFHFSPFDIHRVRHTGDAPAVTLHAYSPPLLSMGAYVVAQDGRLERQAMPSSEELRPLASAGLGGEPEPRGARTAS